MKKNKLLIVLFMFFGLLILQAQQAPERFISHKVKKKETIFGITREYNITKEQLNEYNPLLEKIGYLFL